MPMKIEEEIIESMNKILQACVKIQSGEYSQQIKDEAQRIMTDSFNDAEKQTSLRKIYQVITVAECWAK